MSFRCLSRLIPAVLTGCLLLPTSAEATAITLTNTVDWNFNNTGAQTFTEPSLPTWTHSVTFNPAAQSFISATVAIRHMGNVANSGELWLMYNGTQSVLVGNLSGSGNSQTGQAFIIDTFQVPAGLLPGGFPIGSWTLALKLTESTSGNDTITLDYSTLTVVYDDGQTVVPTVTPEPATLLLFGAGLAALAGVVRRRRANS